MLRNIVCHEIKTLHTARRAFWRCVKSLVKKKSRNFSEKIEISKNQKNIEEKISEHFSHRIMPLNWAETVMPTAGPAPRVHLVFKDHHTAMIFWVFEFWKGSRRQMLPGLSENSQTLDDFHLGRILTRASDGYYQVFSCGQCWRLWFHSHRQATFNQTVQLENINYCVARSFSAGRPKFTNLALHRGGPSRRLFIHFLYV